MRKVTLFICWIIIILAGRDVAAQGFLRADGDRIVNDVSDNVILRGMGLGGWMLQEGYMLQTASFANAQHKIKERISNLIGQDATDEFYQAWRDNHVTKEDIDSLKSWGFNSVRLPMHYNLYTLPIEDEPIKGEHTWLEEGFRLTDNLLSWCAANEMYVILDLHAAPGGQGKDEGISDYDTSKPSLWESTANQDKTVALWHMLADRYKDEAWIGGYDLLNETNWPLENNQALKDIYLRLTDTIRSVDQNHIIFIEGNWFANDFTNLTPPWDDNMVYSPHKYWSINDQASIQWVLDIREQYNVPLYFGESGENSNLWFKDAITLIEGNNIGWAWWPMKKVESIAGPLSVIKTNGYQSLLNYWENGGVRPTASQAQTALMQLTDLLKIESCVYQPDVIDAMFRQVAEEGTIPYETNEIPGIVYAGDFDMGSAGAAYEDLEDANYQVTTGSFTAWNNGWALRNDGVDLQNSEDNTLSNGYNIGWTSANEWIKYSADIEPGTYNVNIRIATERDGGQFHLAVGEAALNKSVNVPATGGWQAWRTVTVRNIVLTDTDDHFRMYIDRPEFNVGSYQFVRTGPTTDVATEFVASSADDNGIIQVTLNKPLSPSDNIGAQDFTLIINGVQVPIDQIIIDPDNPRRIIITTRQVIESTDRLTISYNGTTISSVDGSLLGSFDAESVSNNVVKVHAIPGLIEAEDYFDQVGVQLENTTDNGGGQNIGFLDKGDFLDYYVNVAEAGTHLVEYRTAALSERGAVSLSLVEDEVITQLDLTTFPATGDWQSWTTTSSELTLPQGQHQLRVTIEEPLFNMNWMQFSILTATIDDVLAQQISVSPNPGSGRYELNADDIPRDVYTLDVLSADGKLIKHQLYPNASQLSEFIDLSSHADGTYLIRLQGKSGRFWSGRLVKIGR